MRQIGLCNTVAVVRDRDSDAVHRRHARQTQGRATGNGERRAFSSGRRLTAQKAVDGIKQHTGDWKYDAVSIGIPAPVINSRILHEPHTLGGGNASLLEKLPDGIETCPNDNAFVGGFRLWDDAKLTQE